AFAASHACRLAHRIGKIEDDLRGGAAPGVADHVVDLHLATGPDAACALDTGIEVDRHGRMRSVRRGLPARLEPGSADAEPIAPIAQLVAAGLPVGCRRIALE